tara:strand:+ start:21535 stop:22215 length:681 start_codon:yes stop_codon:yes gene_type:complete
MVNIKKLNYEESNKLIFEKVYFAWPNNQNFIIKNCSFSLASPGLWMLVGKNGCGKSTLMKLIKGLIQPTSGIIHRPENLSLVFQNPDHQILMPTCGSELILNIKAIFSKKEIDEKVKSCLNSVGLEGFFKRPIHTLSGGQKQRLAIASSLISDSSFVLMDEPTALLDQESRRQILKIIKSLINNQNQPITVLWITHRLDELIYADKVAFMKMGKLSQWQDPKDFKI